MPPVATGPPNVTGPGLLGAQRAEAYRLSMVISAETTARAFVLFGVDGLTELRARLVAALPVVLGAAERLTRGLSAGSAQRRVHGSMVRPWRIYSRSPAAPSS